jgi:hypothetical protein
MARYIGTAAVVSMKRAEVGTAGENDFRALKRALGLKPATVKVMTPAKTIRANRPSERKYWKIPRTE